MKLKQHRKHRKFVSSAVSLLLIFTMILSFSVYVFAETPDFTGTIPTEAEKNSLQENREYIPSEKEEMTLSEKGLPIIFEGGIHYIEDPAYPGEKITLFCMNNERHWPHHTEDMGDVQVPEYTEGYLTPASLILRLIIRNVCADCQNCSTRDIRITGNGFIKLWIIQSCILLQKVSLMKC